jgi:Cysteine-rich secretory protein family
VGTTRTAGRRAVPRTRRAVIAAAAAVACLSGTVAIAAGVPGAPASAGAAVAPNDLTSVEGLYASDLVARINAERAARSTAAVPLPALQVDPGLEATAQAWSAQMAATGIVSDPPLTGCGVPLCIFAANSGETGFGYWPGDGSDGMNSSYMASAGHRENMLGAAYENVGVGVTCSGSRAWTVEIFGYPAADMGAAGARQGAQNATEGNPVPPDPVVAGAPSGDPVYCPGQTVGPGSEVTAAGGQYPYPFAVSQVNGQAVVGMASTPDGGGYWVAKADGSVAIHGDAGQHGSMQDQPLDAPIAHIVATPDGGGYWLVAADGGIFSFGDAPFYGSMGGRALNAPVVDMAPTPDGRGYWLVASDGGIFAFGDAAFEGSMGGAPLNQPVVGMVPDRATGGYWLVATDGGVFSFDAPFYGSTGSLVLNQPVNGIAATTDDRGYWFVASDGGLFAFGDAPFRGSAASLPLVAPVVGMATDPSTGGYWLVATDGGIFSFGAPFFGSG